MKHKSILLATAVCYSMNMHAEDIEIFVADESSLQSNVLLLIDTSGSMRREVAVDDDYGSGYAITDFHTPYQACIEWENKCSYSSAKASGDGGGTGSNCTKTCLEYGSALSRMEIVQDVASNLIETTSNLNISLMRYDADAEGGYVDLVSQDIDDSRTIFQTSINSYTPSGNTPLEETYYEAFRYLAGLTPRFGLSTSPETSDNASLSNGQYISPLQGSCQKNNIILFTDGLPTSDTSANADIQALVKNTLPTTLAELSADCSGNGECMDELAYHIKNTDLNDTLDDAQTISTYAIGGFGLENDAVSLLENVAKYGGGTYYSADDANGLSNALEQIVDEILAEDSTFSAPSVSVSAFNSLQHSDELYFALFRPSDGPQWGGNLKRYQLNENNELVDSNADEAIDPDTGFFKASSQSFWSSSDDGESITKGGFAQNLTVSRNVFTFTGDVADNTSLASTAHRLSESNTAITKAMLGITNQNDDYYTNLLAWARGADTEDNDGDGSTDEDARQTIGDPLHNQPVVINYFADKSKSDSTLFFSTNEGFLHALDTDTGAETFAFIPAELLPNLDVYRTDNSGIIGNKAYGLDGPISVWINDANGNGSVLSGENGSAESGDHVYLYANMRRGGKNIYALDVTNRSNPILKWIINGGKGNFTELAQTWSKPTLAKIKLGNEDKTVLIFGGGYDTDQDNATVISPDDSGRAIFIIDADTGQRLWWASSQKEADLIISEMEYSIPTDITVADMNNDGYTDILFAADMGGQLLRIDFNKDNGGTSSLASGGVIARISNEDANNARRFYNRPDVSLIRKRGIAPYLAIAVGSGYREHPLNTQTTDRFYMFKDPNPFSTPTSYEYAQAGKSVITEQYLYDATENLIDSSDADIRATVQTSLDSANGWYITMENKGEKVLAESITYDSKVLFTSFSPSGTKSSTCGPDLGIGRLYMMNLADASPVIDADKDSQREKTDRIYTLTKGGIPASPALISNPNSTSSTPALCVGTECLDIDLNFMPYQKIYWREEQ